MYLGDSSGECRILLDNWMNYNISNFLITKDSRHKINNLTEECKPFGR